MTYLVTQVNTITVIIIAEVKKTLQETTGIQTIAIKIRAMSCLQEINLKWLQLGRRIKFLLWKTVCLDIYKD